MKDEDFFADELYAESTHCPSDFQTTPVSRRKRKLLPKRDYFLRSKKLGFCGPRRLSEDTSVSKRVKSIKFHKSLKKEEVAVKKSIIKTPSSIVPPSSIESTAETSSTSMNQIVELQPRKY